MPRWMVFGVVVMVVFSWVPLALVARARTEKSAEPRMHLVFDMDNQLKYKAQKANALFADGREMRPPVEGTVARGELFDDARLQYGKNDDGSWSTTFPMPVTAQLLARGQERFNIYCAPCHGLAGYGDGMVAQRADQLAEGTWVPPSSLHDATVVARPVGHLFNSISHGIRNMPAYGGQIPVADRWAIVSYIRALQRSQDAKPADVPADRRAALN